MSGAGGPGLPCRPLCLGDQAWLLSPPPTPSPAQEEVPLGGLWPVLSHQRGLWAVAGPEPSQLGVSWGSLRAARSPGCSLPPAAPSRQNTTAMQHRPGGPCLSFSLSPRLLPGSGVPAAACFWRPEDPALGPLPHPQLQRTSPWCYRVFTGRLGSRPGEWLRGRG